MTGDRHAIQAAIAATWPPVATRRVGPFLLREGRGGKRVSAASLEAAHADGDEIAAAVRAMDELNQRPLFVVGPDQTAFDRQLAERAWQALDPTLLYTISAADLAVPPPDDLVYTVWPPLSAQSEIWARGGVGPDRVAVMERVETEKAALFARHEGNPAGTGFVAIHEGVAMVHALEVVPGHRRAGIGRRMMQRAACWAVDRGAETIAALVTEANAKGRGLYDGLGMAGTRGYHYRIAT